MNEKGAGFTGYTREYDPSHEELIVNTGIYDSARARDWEIDQDVFNGKLTYSVLIT